jgi:DNA polymerase III delta prime subunit
MDDRDLSGHPVWLRNVDSALTVAPSFVVHGNLRDRFIVPVQAPAGPVTDGAAPRVAWAPMDLHQALWDTLQRSGFVAIARHTPAGLQVFPDEPAARQSVTAVVGAVAEGRGPVSPAQLAAVARAIVTSTTVRLALTIDYVSQWQPAGQPPSDAEHAFMQEALTLIHDARATVIGTRRPAPLFNPVLWLVERPADLPAWLVGGSDGIRQVSIPRPDFDARLAVARLLVATLARTAEERDGDGVAARAATRFAERSEGMSLLAMMQTAALARDKGLGPDRVEDAVRAYRVGLIDNPWARDELQARIRAGEATLSAKVLGQQRAVRHALDILIRSTTGMTGAELGGRTAGPRGILFFAGPTGVGKTELAKQIAALVFGDESAMIRFDMSEFAADHTEARLIGSPPGYEGHGEGGELTNAVRQRPFSVVLFDEIEKAHPRILDKFLQILSDGRLTDGSGDTVHFGETLIVFTSNLGVPALEPGSPVPSGDQLEALVKEAIEHEFEVTINRPELLGRIGESNVVVFDYISGTTARELAGHFVDNVVRTAAERRRIELVIPPDVRDQVVGLAVADLSKGGRGLSRAIESVLVNPLSRALFGLSVPGQRVTVSALRREVGGWYSVVLT